MVFLSNERRTIKPLNQTNKHSCSFSFILQKQNDDEIRQHMAEAEARIEMGEWNMDRIVGKPVFGPGLTQTGLTYRHLVVSLSKTHYSP